MSTVPTTHDVTPRPERVWLVVAIVVTILLHLLGAVCSLWWKLTDYSSLDSFAKSAPRFFQLADITPKPVETPVPGLRAGGIQPEFKPGAAEVQRPRSSDKAFDKAFSVNTPSLGAMPKMDLKLDSAPVAALPSPSAPTLLAFSDQGSMLTGPVAPQDARGTGQSANLAATPSSSVQLPLSQPGTYAVEDLSAIEGGGIGLGGAGTGALPEFSDVDKLINVDLREKITSSDGLIIRLANEVLFDFDKDTLRPEAGPLLAKIATVIRRYPGCAITISGHTDTFGADDYNQALAERRARSVGAWLKERESAAIGTLSMIGFGKSRPIVNPRGSVTEQRANRRVEILIKARKDTTSPVAP
jgi:outer membrane protein OmpA-like peptidoglycan-associated protein